MAFAIKGRIDGLKDVLAQLAKLGSQTTRSKILRKAMDQATKPVLAAARAQAPKRTGLLAKSIGRKIKTYRSSGVVAVIIGPRSGYKRALVQGRGGKLRATKKTAGKRVVGFANPVKYAHLVELGTRRSQAKPFLKPAFDSLQGSVMGNLRKLILEGIEREAAKR